MYVKCKNTISQLFFSLIVGSCDIMYCDLNSAGQKSQLGILKGEKGRNLKKKTYKKR